MEALKRPPRPSGLHGPPREGLERAEGRKMKVGEGDRVAIGWPLDGRKPPHRCRGFIKGATSPCPNLG